MSISIIWIPMMEADTRRAALKSARIVRDPRVRHFYDPTKLTGGLVAASLGGEGKAAWDVYLLYEKGSVWGAHPPAPAYWVHQLQGSRWADEPHYRCGDSLVAALRKM